MPGRVLATIWFATAPGERRAPGGVRGAFRPCSSSGDEAGRGSVSPRLKHREAKSRHRRGTQFDAGCARAAPIPVDRGKDRRKRRDGLRLLKRREIKHPPTPAALADGHDRALRLEWRRDSSAVLRTPPAADARALESRRDSCHRHDRSTAHRPPFRRRGRQPSQYAGRTIVHERSAR